MNRSAFATALLGAALALACGTRSAPSAPQPPANEVWLTAEQSRQVSLDTAVVAESPIGGLVRTVGRLAFDDRRVAHVFSPVSGRVTRLLVDLGQHVRRGQPLALLDSPDMGSALSDLHKAEATLLAAQQERTRQQELYEAHAGARRDLEAAEAAYQNALAERDRARQHAALFYGGSTSGVSQGFQLRSPISGEVVARGANPGMELQGQYGGTGAPELYTVGDLNQLWLLADIPEADVFKVRIGAPVQFQVDGYEGPAFTGRIDWVSETLDPATRTARVRCEVPNGRHLLKPEMYAQVSIQVPPTLTLAMPRTAVVRLGTSTYAFVDLGTGPDGTRRFERRPVEVDEQVAGDLVPVRRGLHPGERVVTRG
ncbi:MAG TPA: efflux RND transporter periplasmic adaptor subunit, partial [Holophagaceae bacterium]